MAVLAVACAAGCASSGGSSEPPAHCIDELEWYESDLVVIGRTVCAEPTEGVSEEDRARCNREDYLEAYCRSVNDYSDRLSE